MKPQPCAAYAKAIEPASMSLHKHPMTTPTSASDSSSPSASNGAAHSLHHTLSEAAMRAQDQLLQATDTTAQLLSETAHALQRGTREAFAERPWTDRARKLGDQLSSQAQHLARQSLDLAAHAGAKAQDSWGHYAKVSQGYVAKQPVRSVLMAAAVGAALMLWLSASRKR